MTKSKREYPPPLFWATQELQLREKCVRLINAAWTTPLGLGRKRDVGTGKGGKELLGGNGFIELKWHVII